MSHKNNCNFISCGQSCNCGKTSAVSDGYGAGVVMARICPICEDVAQHIAIGIKSVDESKQILRCSECGEMATDAVWQKLFVLRKNDILFRYVIEKIISDNGGTTPTWLLDLAP